MADISIICPKCGKATTVSEFADGTNLTCRSCQAPLEKPGAVAATVPHDGKTPDGTTPPSGRSALRLAKRKKEYTQPAEGDDAVLKELQDQAATQGQDGDLELRPEVKSDRHEINHALIAGVLFLALGALMGWLRYGGVLRSDWLAYSVDYAWIAFLVCHVLIVLRALADNMMQGILCLLIPGYSLFYVFAVSDDFYLRAIFGAVLIGIGQDAAIELNERAANIAGVAHAFIQEGGGDIR